ncbi:hypothetical protein JHK82_024233 [Glycine max]|uniref:Uncharacterized protein n=2 Tax=Glycine subgen. Soja TaxID=1462606 RepID=A0A0R0IB24_SOYBN|nr:hypothetical protein JHK85_024804 [Glycine max]KAG5133045.1 hypothetical protein JHK82_024233 [Glycine max]KAH1041864.1 hypothetical protein GYH30_024276 [Glycine max]RZB90970.1 hypothetical protein D0Y65_023396 [Glycine soja]
MEGSNEGPHRYSNLNLEEKKTQTIKQRIKNKYLAIEKVNCYCFFVHLRYVLKDYCFLDFVAV